MSEDAQVEVLAKDKDVVSRADLATTSTPRRPAPGHHQPVAGKGETPVALNFQQRSTTRTAPGYPGAQRRPR